MIAAVTNTNNFTHTLGARQYELSNHLGNVLAVISDRKYARDIDNTGEIDYYEPDVLVTYDYSPFGVILKDRNFEKQICEEQLVTNTLTVENNPFNATSIDGWLPLGSLPTNNTVSNVSNTLRIAKGNNSSGGSLLGAKKDLVITSLEPHTISFDYRSGNLNGTNKIRVKIIDLTTNVTTILAELGLHAAFVNYSYTFTPNTIGNYQLVFERINSTNTNREFFIDNVLITFEEESITCNCIDGSSYRYGFNGMEKDDEVKGSGNSYTTLYRQYDSRLGRWQSLDPAESELPWQSPYIAMNGNPILLKDPNGDKVPVKFTRSARKELGVSKQSLKQGEVPEKLQTLYNKEYGIKIGLEVSNKKFLGITVGKKYDLIYTGDIKTDLTTSPTAIEMWKEKLDPKSVATGQIVFDGKGTDWAIPGQIAHINVGTYSTEDYTDPSAEYYNGSAELRRSFNMARIIEHEYLGHVVMGVYDYTGQDSGGGKPYGKTEFHNTTDNGTAMQVVNKFRREMGLPERLAYDRQRDIDGNGKIDKNEKSKTTILFFGSRETGGDVRLIIFNK
jgi:RHS repeat-associated protein